MNLQLAAIRTYFTVYSTIAPKMAAKQSFKVFQKVRKKTIRPREASFFEQAKQSTLVTEEVGQVDYFELGNPAHPLVFLIHGWDSNAGSLSKMAEKMVEMNHYVVSMNLPGHADSKKNATNLLECKQAFKALIMHINPVEPFSVISHSFGSAVTAYALSETNHKVDKLVFLTNPNRVEHIFDAFKKTIGLRNRAFRELLRITDSKLGEPLAAVSVENKLKTVDFKALILIHDKFDKVLAYKHSLEVKEAFPSAQLVPFEKIGHYKMLWNEKVINACAEHFN